MKRFPLYLLAVATLVVAGLTADAGIFRHRQRAVSRSVSGPAHSKSVAKTHGGHAAPDNVSAGIQQVGYSVSGPVVSYGAGGCTGNYGASAGCTGGQGGGFSNPVANPKAATYKRMPNGAMGANIPQNNFDYLFQESGQWAGWLVWCDECNGKPCPATEPYAVWPATGFAVYQKPQGAIEDKAGGKLEKPAAASAPAAKTAGEATDTR